MALKLFKLVATATTTTTVNPANFNYFYTQSTAVTTTVTTLTLSASKFLKNNGSAATAIVTVTSANGTYMLYINAELQQTGIYTVSASKVVLTLATGLSIPASAVISLAVSKFTPNSSTSVHG